jgi:hypothetical protein
VTEPTQSSCVELAHIVEDRDVGPMSSEDGATEHVTLTEGNGAHPRSLEPEAESADAAEEIKDIH